MFVSVDVNDKEPIFERLLFDVQDRMMRVLVPHPKVTQTNTWVDMAHGTILHVGKLMWCTHTGSHMIQTHDYAHNHPISHGLAIDCLYSACVVSESSDETSDDEDVSSLAERRGFGITRAGARGVATPSSPPFSAAAVALASCEARISA